MNKSKKKKEVSLDMPEADILISIYSKIKFIQRQLTSHSDKLSHVSVQLTKLNLKLQTQKKELNEIKDFLFEIKNKGSDEFDW